MSPGPLASLWFTISIWISLTILVRMKSHEIKGLGNRARIGPQISIIFVYVCT